MTAFAKRKTTSKRGAVKHKAAPRRWSITKAAYLEMEAHIRFLRRENYTYKHNLQVLQEHVGRVRKLMTPAQLEQLSNSFHWTSP
jgi:hypothetical protein